MDRTPIGCRPADEDSANVLKRIPLGTTFEADIITRKTRSGAWHRRYWLLMSMLASHCESVEIEPGLVLPITDSESAHVAMKYCTGLYDSYVLKVDPEGPPSYFDHNEVSAGGSRPGAIVVRLLKSTAFDKMDADEWTAYYARVLDAVHHKFLPGVEIPELADELARMAS